MMAHGDARKGMWRRNWRLKWVASTLHTTSEHGVSSITTADAHTSAASSRLNWRPRRCKWTRPFRRKTKSCFCACAITFQLASTFVPQKRDPSVAQMYVMYLYPVPHDGRMNCRNMQLKKNNEHSPTHTLTQYIPGQHHSSINIQVSLSFNKYTRHIRGITFTHQTWQ